MKALIIGCGYLGTRVASAWLSGGHKVYVVTRTQSRADRFQLDGFHPIIADVTDAESLAGLPDDCDVVLFAVGYDRSMYSDIRDVYVVGLQHVLNQIGNDCGHFIYISSTGVYGDCDSEWVTESSATSPIRPGGKACLAAEKMIGAAAVSPRATILRLAGIYGPDRVPRLAALGKSDWSALSSEGHINLIHVADAVRIVIDVERQNLVNELFLVSDGNPVPRRTFYQYIAAQLGVGPINWSVVSDLDVARRSDADKKVSNQKLIEATGFQYLFPDYRSGVSDAIARLGR